MNTLLPAGFEALAPFVEFWAVDTAAQRARCRDVSTEEQRLAFYKAAVGLVPQALDLLDSKPLNELNDSEQRLMKLLLSFAHVAAAVELQRDEEPKHALARSHMRITRAPADQPFVSR
jgi:hypothetical protein